MNKIIEISKKPYVAIFSDNRQYVVWIGKRMGIDKKGKEVESGIIVWYFPTLEMCFQEIFEWFIKKELSKQTCSDLEELKKILVETKEKIRDIIKPLETL